MNASLDFRAYILPFLITIHHSLTALEKIAHAQMCTSSVLNNTKNIVSKTTLMKCQLSLGSKPTKEALLSSSLLGILYIAVVCLETCLFFKIRLMLD